MNPEEKVTYFGETDARNQRLKFGIKQKDRTRHMYVIGKTGMGKSTLLENLAIQDIMDGNGFAFIDPHGKTADLLLEYIPKERINDVVYFAPFDLEYPIAFNVMEDVGAERRHLVASGLMSAFKKIWVDAWSARMEYILGNIMLALLEYPGSTLIGVNRMLADKDYRKKIVDNITDPSVRSFWVDEYAKYTDKFAAEAAPAIQNKVGQFVANPLVRNIIGQAKSTFDIRKIMDEKKILIINLSKGRVGESNANLLGSMLITKIYLAAMSRADLKEKELEAAPQFYLYVDEFQSFANESFADILSEARKYKLNLTIAHQYIEQMSEEVRAAVFGNVGSMVTFRVGAYDAEVLEKEFAPQFTAEDLVNLQKYQMYLKLMIDGVTSPPFSATGMGPYPRPEMSYVQDIIDASRRQFAKPRYEVEDAIRKWHEPEQGQGGTKSGDKGGDRGGERTGDRGTDGQRKSGTPGAFGNQQRQGGQSGQGQPRSQGGFGSQGQQGNAGPNQKPNRKEREAREVELRKALSLSYLKPEPEVKNDQKAAKPENVAALREALLTVMKEAQVPIPEAISNPQPKVELKPEVKSEVKVEQPTPKPQQPVEPKVEPTPAEPKPPKPEPQKIYIPKPVQPVAPEVKVPESLRPQSTIEQPKVENQNPSTTEQTQQQSAPNFPKRDVEQSRRSVAEVPEEVLKKILDTNN